MKVTPLFLLLFFFLSGCASNASKNGLDSEHGLKTNHGVVSIQVTNNMDALTDSTKNWTGVYLIRVDNLEAKKKDFWVERQGDSNTPGKKKWSPDFVQLIPLAEGQTENTLFVGQAPAGTYQIYSIWSKHNHNRKYIETNELKTNELLGTFSVEPRRLTDLGVVVFQKLSKIKDNTNYLLSPNFKEWESGAVITRSSKQNKRVLDSIYSTYPMLTGQIQARSALPWDADEFSTQRNLLQRSITHNQHINKIFPLNKTGQSLLTNQLGTVIYIDNKGTQTQFDLAENLSVNSILELDGKIVLGTERGSIFILDLGLKKVIRKDVINANEAIMLLAKQGKGYLAVSQSDKEVAIYTFSDFEKDWNQIKLVRSMNDAALGEIPVKTYPILSQSGALKLFVGEDLHEYSEGKWYLKKVELVESIQTTPKNVLIGVSPLGFLSGGEKLFSVDEGKTWNALGMRFVQEGKFDAVFLDKQKVAGIVEKSSFAKEEKKSAYEAGGKNTKVSTQKELYFNVKSQENGEVLFSSKMPIGCDRIIANASDSQNIYVKCADQSIIVSYNQGKDWVSLFKSNYSQLEKSTQKLTLLTNQYSGAGGGFGGSVLDQTAEYIAMQGPNLPTYELED